MKDLHSYVIPAFGDSPYLEECIQSLMHQTKKSSILITTSTPSQFIFEVAQKYQLEVRINPKGNKNIAGDWNFAYDQAQTPFVTLAHQDELFHPGYTEGVVRLIQQSTNKKILIIFTDYREMMGNTLRKQPSVHSRIKKLLLFPFLLKPNIASRRIKRAILSLGTPICCSSVTFHKELLKDFSFSDRFKVALDWHAWLALSEKKGNFSFINKKLIFHRIHPGSETYRQIQSGLRYEEELAIFTSIWGRAIAHLLMKFYALGHHINTKNE